MHERWYKQAVIYCLDVETFQDSDGDGVGDLAGLTSRLDYLARLGATCIWLNPIHPGPNRDDATTWPTSTAWIPASVRWATSPSSSTRPATGASA
ncbi:MAG TPA: alpha-amylase family glycosyl hydrolase [Acidimicrobiales bacterium]|nr:alpha-amylase family glycosyl hydrolase [Acidimicrobiales bacterium]